MRRWCIVFLLLCWIPAQLSASEEDDLLRGMVYFMVEDIPAASAFIEKHFRVYPNPQVRQGYMLLLNGKSWDATRRFGSYLEINHRSAKALVGIAMATRETKNSNSLENLERAVRLHPRFYTGYVCLGWHFQQARNHERALANYQAALAGSRIAEVKILLAGLHVRMGRPDLAEALIREEADAHPDNFHFNYMTALAMVNAGHIDQAGGYISTALELKPGHRELSVLRARYLYRKGDLAQAQSLLAAVKAPEFNEEYLKIHSRVLIALKQARRARPMLYQLFRELPWDVEVNLLMGDYFKAFQPQASDLAQHWLRRALLAGLDKETARATIPENQKLDAPQGMAFFSIRQLCWPSMQHLLLVGRRSGGASEQIHVVDPGGMRTVATLNYHGRFSGFHCPRGHKTVFFSTSDVGGERTFLYQLALEGRRARAVLLTSRPLPLPAIILGTNQAGSLVYVTDSRLLRLPFESPFSITSQFGRKTPLYPQCPLPVFMLNRRIGRWTQLKSEQMLAAVPIKSWKRYRLVQQARLNSREVESLIKRGQGFDISSPEIVRIIFAPDGRTMLIYLADLENAFQAVIYDTVGRSSFRCDQRMFLGKKSFADVDVKGIDPKGSHILLVTRDQDHEGILFNYKSRLYLSLGFGVLDTWIVPGWQRIYLLKETGNRLHAVETRLDEIHFNPYVKNQVTQRDNLTRLVALDPRAGLEAVTYDGERLRIQAGGEVKYCGVSLEGALHATAPDHKSRVAFINGRLIMVPPMDD